MIFLWSMCCQLYLSWLNDLKFLIALSSQICNQHIHLLVRGLKEVIFTEQLFNESVVPLSLCHTVRRRGNSFLLCRSSVTKFDCTSQLFQQSCNWSGVFSPCHNCNVIHRLFSLYRQARKDEQAANVKVDEMTRSTERLQSQLERKVL